MIYFKNSIIYIISLIIIYNIRELLLRKIHSLTDISNYNKSNYKDDMLLINETKSLINETKLLVNETRSLINNIKRNFIKRETKNNDRIEDIFTNETKPLNNSLVNYNNLKIKSKKVYIENCEKNQLINNIEQNDIEDIYNDNEYTKDINDLKKETDDIEYNIIDTSNNIIDTSNNIEYNIIDTSNNIEEEQIQKKSNYNLKDIYNNFFNYDNNKKKKDKSIKYDTIDNDNIENNNLNPKSYSILNDVKNNIKIDRVLTYTFISKKNNYYRIKCKLLTNNTSNINNIKLVISDNEKKFIYDYSKYNLFDTTINQYGFTLDFNNFDIDALINIEIYFYNKNNENIIIDNAVIDIIESNILTDNNSLIIFNINGKYNTIYSNISNILDYKDPLENYIDSDNLFFI